MNKFDLLSVGDASIDIYITPSESESLSQMDDKESFICFAYGDKIPVKSSELSVGGNAANNAVGVTRLGVKTGLVLTLGDDTFGNQIQEKLNTEGIDTTYVIKQPGVSSNFSVIVNYSGERTIFTYNVPKSYEYPVNLPITPWMYLTSMGDTFKPFYNHIADFLRTNTTVKLAFNPGSRQIRAGVNEIIDILKLTEVLFVNREEAEKLTDFGQSLGKEKELLQALSNLGIKIPVVTDGVKGSYAFDGSRFVKAGVLPVDAYERTGAGDAFGSGTLAAIIKGKPLEEALLWGTSNSASVIGYTGPQRGLIKENEMDVWLERARSSEVKVGEF
ncbi:MAG: carbohydrate kinase family protein [Patescibacteria group bacterium]|nr:carbohydrate kinase family protein [Patescibacteria group bacterium]